MIDPEDEYVIDWKIENFSCCTQTTGQSLSTCQFTCERLDNTTWKILLYPKGKLDENYISCFLARTDDNKEGPKKIYVYFEFSLVTSNGLQCEKTVMCDSNSFELESNWGFNFIKRDVIFADKDAYLLKDVLTLRCRMGKYIPQVRKNCINVFRTRNCTQNSNVRMAIENFKKVTKNDPEVLHINTTNEKGLLTVNVYVGEDEAVEGDPKETMGVKDADSASNSSVHIDIERNRLLPSIFLLCHVRVVDKFKRVTLEHTADHIYKKVLQKETWSFPRFIKIKELTTDMIQDNTLNLEFDISVCNGQQSTYLEEDLIPQKPKRVAGFKTLKNDLTTLCETRIFSDAKLKIGSECFPVHKSILSIRSPVFRKLFEEHATAVFTEEGNDPKNGEKIIIKYFRECILEINDVDRDTLKHMLNFVYANMFDVNDFASGLSLYVSAQKYEISSLKSKCYNFLKNHMSITDTLKAFAIADELNDEDLKLLTINVIKYNHESVSFTEEWVQECQKEQALWNEVKNHITRKK